MLSNIRDGRLHLPGRTVPLADPVLDRLCARLDERQRRWPLTANPHLFINQQNATRTSTAQVDWITKRLGISAQAIREDRILHEAHATRDVRRLIDLLACPSKAPSATPPPSNTRRSVNWLPGVTTAARPLAAGSSTEGRGFTSETRPGRLADRSSVMPP